MSRPAEMVTATGIRTRVAVVAAIATVALLSIVGAIGYVAAVAATRQSQEDLLNERLDSLESKLAEGETPLTAQLELDTSVRVIRAGQGLPAPASGVLQVVRESDAEDIDYLVGTASTVQLDRTFGTIRRGLWVSIGLTGLLVGFIAWLVVDKALAPVRLLTSEAEAVEADSSKELIQVGAAGDELSHLATTFNRMLTKLRAADVDRRRFVSDASHELRTPLMVLTADAEYAAANGGEIDTLATSVLEQSARLTSLVDDLLTLASFDEQQHWVSEPITIVDVLATAQVEEQRAIVDDDDRQRRIPNVSRAVGNIFSNAERFSATAVNIHVACNGGLVTFTFDDDGPGVPVAERDEIFKRFYRADESRTRPRGGAGLGLAIARAEVHRAGGSITVSESPMGGARFIVTVSEEQAPHDPNSKTGMDGTTPRSN